jgi:FkbM family methyltransferase
MEWIYKRVYLPIFVGGEHIYNLGEYQMKLNLQESQMMRARRSRNYEPSVSEVINSRLDEGGFYIDIGTNQGYHALDAAITVGENGRVICFEPDSNNYDTLTENISINSINNIATHQLAVSNKSGEVPFKKGNRSGTGQIAEVADHTVRAVTLDNYLSTNSIPPQEVDLVKIDVEGKEAAVIEGMENFLDKAQDCIIIVEVHTGADIQKMASTLLNAEMNFKKPIPRFWLVSNGGSEI